MKRSFIILPFLHKMAVIVVATFMLLFFLYLPIITLFSKIGFILIFLFIYYFVLLANAGLKIDDDNIYIFRVLKWEKIDIERIQYARINSSGLLRIRIDKINLLNTIYVGIIGSEGYEAEHYINKLISEREKNNNDNLKK